MGDTRELNEIDQLGDREWCPTLGFEVGPLPKAHLV